MNKSLKKSAIALILGLTAIVSLPTMAQQNTLDEGHQVESVFPDFNIDSKKFKEAGNGDFLKAEEAFEPSLWRDDDNIYLSFNTKEGYYIYEDKLSIKSSQDDLKLSNIVSIDSIEKEDPYFGKTLIIEGKTVIKAPIKHLPSEENQPLSITYQYQGCAEAGLCYPVKTITEKAPFQEYSPKGMGYHFDLIKDATNKSIEIEATSKVQKNVEVDNTDVILNDHGYLIMLITFFLAGLALTFTPCVLPMLPIASAVIAGNYSNRVKGIRSAFYVAGMVTAYTLMGLAIGLFGSELNLQAKIQSPWVIIPIASIFILLASYLFGWMNMPGGKLNNTITQWQDKIGKGNVFSIYVTGFISVLVVSPCVSAPLAGAMLYLSTTGDVLTSGLALMALSLGMGIPLVVIALLGSSILPKSGEWMNAVKDIFGVVLIGMALWLIDHLLPTIVMMLSWAFIIALVGMILFHLEKKLNLNNIIAFSVRIIVCALFIFSTLIFIGGITGGHQPFEPLKHLSIESKNKEAKQALKWNVADNLEDLENFIDNKEGKSTFLYFGADWCISCKMLENEVFVDNEIVSSLQDYNLVKGDITKDSKEVKDMLKEYGVFGPPTMFVINEDGVVLHTIVGEVDKEELNTSLK